MRNSKTDLISYYPEFLRENLEFNALCDASNPEFDLIWERLRQIELNILPQTADENGLAQYEEWLGLRSNPYEDLETRRARVIAKLNETLPYTEIRLQRMLAAIVGWGHFHYERHGALVRVTLDVTCFNSAQVVYEMLDRILPLNLHFEIILGHVYEEDVLELGIGTKETHIIETPIIKTDERIAKGYFEKANTITEIIETPITDNERIIQVFINSGVVDTEIIETRGE